MPDFLDPARPFWEPIGCFVIRFGYLEKEIDVAIGYLLIVHNRQSEAVTSQIKNLSGRINLIHRLVVLLTSDKTVRQRAMEITKELRRLNTYRNNLVHGPWGGYVSTTGGDGYWLKNRFDGNDFKTKVFEVRIDDIKANTNAAAKVRAELSNFSRDVTKKHLERHGYVPWFDKLPPRLPKADQSQD
jgi:hypothetical protein